MSIQIVDAKNHFGTGPTFQRFKEVRSLTERISHFVRPRLLMTEAQEKLVENMDPFVDGPVDGPLHCYLELSKGVKPHLILLSVGEDKEVDGALFLQVPKNGVAEVSYLGTARFSDVATVVNSLVKEALAQIYPDQLVCEGRISALQKLLGTGEIQGDRLVIGARREDLCLSRVSSGTASTVPCGTPTGMHSPSFLKHVSVEESA